MSITLYVVLFAIGAAVVALWITVRFPKLMSWKMAVLLVHLVLALLSAYAVAPAMGFAIAFPVLVYNFLVGSWMIRLAQASGAGFRA